VAIATGQGSPAWLTTDAQRVYWATDGGHVVAANKDGTDASTLLLPFLPPVLSNRGPVLLGDLMYWAENSDVSPFSTDLFDFGPLSIATPSTFSFARLEGRIVDMVASPTTVFMTNADLSAIMSFGPSGTSEVFSPPLYPGNTSVAIAIDATNVYWTEMVGAPGQSRVVRAPQSGAGPITTVATGGLTVPESPRTLAVNGTNAYFVNRINGGVALAQVPAAGGTVINLRITGNPVAVAADSSGVYWLDSTAGSVFKVATGTTAVVTLATGQAISAVVSGAIAVDSVGVYWGTTTTVMALAK
jgi:hypothetical protein